VKRSTAIRRLADVADGLDRAAPWPDCTVVAAHVFGPLLDTLGDVEGVQLAFVVDEPVESVAWLCHPARLEALAALLRFDKLPLEWWWRPAGWPVWNHHIERALCVWTVAGGRDQGALDALATGPVDSGRTTQPAKREQLVAQLVVERDVARRHLADVVARFYDRDWRHQHSGFGVYPEAHLWWATSGYLDLDDAIKDTAS
jgi:hypothetical protein